MRKNICVSAAAFFIAVFLAGGMAAETSFAGEYATGIDAFSYGPYEVPAYDGDPSEEVNGDIPIFSEEELSADPFIAYGDLDNLGRCTPAFGELNKSLMPTEKRGSISSVYPSGWVQAKYDIVSGGYLYNRCHLIGYQLGGADLNHLSKSELAKDLITGTRYLNVGTGNTGMVEYENEVADYLKKNPDRCVAYRVSPVFFGNDLVASGVLMEGQSTASDDVSFCVFCYNVQPEIAIDYETGKSKLASAVEENKPISECQITVGEKRAYTGSERSIPVTIMDGEKLLKKGSDYRLVYANNRLPGLATVQIAGIGSYKGVVSACFVIVPARASVLSLRPSKVSIRVEAKKQTGASGYQYRYREKGKSYKSISYRGNVRILKGLKSKKVYQVKVRAYKTIEGQKWYGKWSPLRTVRTK